MAVIQATNKSNVPELELGEVYRVKVKSVEEAEQDSKFGKSDFPREVITYTVLDDDGRPLKSDAGEVITLKQWVTLYNPMRPRSAVYGVISALLFGGEAVPEGELVDTDDLVGKPGRITWGLKENPTTKEKTPGITQVMPPSKKTRRAVTEEEIDAI